MLVFCLVIATDVSLPCKGKHGIQYALQCLKQSHLKLQHLERMEGGVNHDYDSYDASVCDVMMMTMVYFILIKYNESHYYKDLFIYLFQGTYYMANEEMCYCQGSLLKRDLFIY